jgi:hypothetical protein
MHVIKWPGEFAPGMPGIDARDGALVGMISALDASRHGDDSSEVVHRLPDGPGAYVRDHSGFERLMACCRAPRFVRRRR